MEMAPEGSLKLERANEIIMAARAHWFEGDEGGADAAADANPANDAASAEQQEG